MKPSTRIAFFAVILFLATAGGAWFLKTIDPEQAPLWQFGLLYGIVFVWMFAFATVAGYVVRRIFLGPGAQFQSIRVANRQGLIFGFFSVVVLLLQAARILSPWTAGLVIIIFLFIELYSQ